MFKRTGAERSAKNGCGSEAGIESELNSICLLQSLSVLKKYIIIPGGQVRSSVKIIRKFDVFLEKKLVLRRRIRQLSWQFLDCPLSLGIVGLERLAALICRTYIEDLPWMKRPKAHSKKFLGSG